MSRGVRAVTLARGAVQHTAVRLHQSDERHFPEILRTLEHHVFEQMRKTRAVLRLVTKPDVIGDGDRGDRGRAIDGEYDAEPVDPSRDGRDRCLVLGS